MLFPYDSIRPQQKEMIDEVERAVKTRGQLLCHAPTGSGKTVNIFAPAIPLALRDNLTVFFLTSRHTQHIIAIKTLQDIKEQSGVGFNVLDIVGKKHMCPMPEIEALYSSEFAEYCKAVRENGKCDYYLKTRKGPGTLTDEAKDAVESIQRISPVDSERIVELGGQRGLCSYELAIALASKAQVVIADYNYIFNPHIREYFFKKAGKSLDKSVIIVDEGHNLPGRLQELMTSRLSDFILESAVKEAEKFHFHEVKDSLVSLKALLRFLGRDMATERLVGRSELSDKIGDYDELTSDLETAGEIIREKQKRSFVSSVAAFLEAWQGEDTGFLRVLKKTAKGGYVLSYRCIDPSILTADVLKECHSMILMSGTLTPTTMYRDILGMSKDAVEKTFPSPFPANNRLNLIVPLTTTKYERRSPDEYKRIATIVADMINLTPGHSAVFFPSYAIKDEIKRLIDTACTKTIFSEDSSFTKEQKKEFLERFKEYDNACLLGVAHANFAEGIDLPGLLKSVVVVGLPLQSPDLETKGIIDYYQSKFGRGWEYGYIFPAMNKVFQSAGRCIRSEEDRGVIIFLDERFAWNNYLKCFPKDWKLNITKEYKREMKGFFKEN